jgi:GNAT superfamily N-acetyltransferase
MNIKYHLYIENIPHEVISDIENLYKDIFQADDASKIKIKLAQEQNICVQVAYHEAILVGFKIGYSKDNTLYYSWLGAVHQDFRGHGIAKKLMLQQHQWCKEQGFEKIQTKTLNHWKAMLILNLQVGFDILSAYESKEGVLKIILEKKLD